MPQLSFLSALAVLLCLFSLSLTHAEVPPPDISPLFTGIGRIHILNATTLGDASPSDVIGCLNARGAFTPSLSDCGEFTRNETWPHELSSSQGACTFMDGSAEENLQSIFGKGSYAYSCTDGEVPGDVTNGRGNWYTVNGFKYLFICTGNIGCIFEIPVPDKGKNALPVWQFYWTGEHQGPTPGHMQVVWLWEPVVEKPEARGRTVPSGFVA